MGYTFEVNRCFDDSSKDEIHAFESLKAMREFIDIDDCYPMEVTVYHNGDQVITMPHSCYWRKDKHPTLKQLIEGGS